MIKKIMKTSLAALTLGLGIMSAGVSHAETIEFDLTGLGSSVHGFGSDGLYLGRNFRRGHNNARKNWTFNGVSLSINDTTGVGTIRGNMTRQSDNSEWGIDVKLDDLVIRTGTGSATSRHNYNASSDNLSAILSSSSVGTGVEWQSLSMTPTSPTPFWGYAGSTTSTWSGLAMPKLGHINVAEFYLQENYLNSGIDGLIFDAWYQRADCRKCKFQVGDTKAIATQVSPVPLPGAVVLFGSGLLGFLGMSKRKVVLS
ncbi:MAG: hypothetical protein V3V31_00740 [Methylococcales bacterium]